MEDQLRPAQEPKGGVRQQAGTSILIWLGMTFGAFGGIAYVLIASIVSAIRRRRTRR